MTVRNGLAPGPDATDDAAGGVAQLRLDATLTAEHCTFANNVARYGGVVTVSSAVNELGIVQGGSAQSAFSAKHCTFIENAAMLGGVAAVDNFGSFTADHCTFLANHNQVDTTGTSTGGAGGVVWASPSGTAVVIRHSTLTVKQLRTASEKAPRRSPQRRKSVRIC